MAKTPSSAKSYLRLRHGTTMLRALHLLQHGPDPTLVVGGDTAYGLSTAPIAGPFPLGAPEDYAQLKARLFPKEGGPAMLEMEVPAPIVALALCPGGEAWFGPGFGLEELLAAWPQIVKRIVSP